MSDDSDLTSVREVLNDALEEHIPEKYHDEIRERAEPAINSTPLVPGWDEPIDPNGFMGEAVVEGVENAILNVYQQIGPGMN
jgi:hypothetical protein